MEKWRQCVQRCPFLHVQHASLWHSDGHLSTQSLSFTAHTNARKGCPLSFPTSTHNRANGPMWILTPSQTQSCFPWWSQCCIGDESPINAQVAPWWNNGFCVGNLSYPQTLDLPSPHTHAHTKHTHTHSAAPCHADGGSTTGGNEGVKGWQWHSQQVSTFSFSHTQHTLQQLLMWHEHTFSHSWLLHYALHPAICRRYVMCPKCMGWLCKELPTKLHKLPTDIDATKLLKRKIESVQQPNLN